MNQYRLLLTHLLLTSLVVFSAACTMKTARRESSASAQSSQPSSFATQEQERAVASAVADKTAMQLRLRPSTAAEKAENKKIDSQSASLQGDDIESKAQDKIVSENVKIEKFSGSTAPMVMTTNKTGWPKHEALNPVDPSIALGWLKNGNTRYVKGRLRSDGQSQKDRTRTMASEKPHTVILACSDSRIPPEVVFDQKLGEVYVVRSAGEALDTATVASLEYAISQLGVRFLVVMGHDSCTSVKAAVNHLEHPAEMGSPAMNELMANLKPRLEGWDRMPASESGAEWANVHGAAKDLLKKSEIVRSAIKEGRLKIGAALYNLNSGVVQWQ